MSRHFWKTADYAPPLEQPEHRCLRDLGGGGGGTTQTNTVQKSDPWSGVQPYLQNLFQGAQNRFEGGAYAGPYLGAQSTDTATALQMQADRARAGSPLTGAGQQSILSTIRGDYLRPDSNPYLQGAVQQGLDQVKRNVSSQFRGDNYGSSANQEWLAKKLSDSALPIYAQNYQTERGRQLAATGMAPQFAAQDYADIDRLAAVGATRDARNQAEVEAGQRKANADWEHLANFQRILGAAGGYGATTSSSESPYFSDPLGRALGLGIGGLTLYNGLGAAGLLGAGSAFGSAGGMAGAADIFSTLGPLALA